MKKSKENKLIGRTVIVHPYLTTDPLQRQGHAGKITEVSDQDNNIVTVEFKDGVKAAYLSGGLLTLYPKVVILQGLQSNQMSEANRELIFSVYKLAGRGEIEAALHLAMKNDTSRFFCTTTCADWLEMKKEKKKQNKNPHKKHRQ
ncbi:MAG: hypothetical protein ACTHJ8_08895 [Mucilaginibacter sp.]